MLTIGDKEYRNLEEQVQKNQEDIKYILEERGVLNEFGIRVVGQVDTAGELPESSEYDGEYGDAFVVGTSEPYTFYIWTRAFSGQANPFWLNIGQFPGPSTVPGPEGPQGQPGETGQRGSRWQSNETAPPVTGANLRFDQALDTSTGDVYQFTGSVWQFIGNIRGPQGIQGIQGPAGPQGNVGPQGPAGPQGPQGEFIQIAGELASINQLPSPTSVPRYTAYLISVDGTNHVYLISGTDELIWIDAGAFGGGAKINASGNAVTELDATYVNVDGTETLIPSAVSKEESGVQVEFTESFTNAGNVETEKTVQTTLPIIDSATIELVVQGQTIYLDLTTDQKQQIANAVQKVATPNIIYGNNADGTQTQVGFSADSQGGTIVQRQNNGNITVPTIPQVDSDAVAKKYVDDTGNALRGQIVANQGEISARVKRSGDTMTGSLTAPGFAFSSAPATNANPTYLIGMNSPLGSWAPVSLGNLSQAILQVKGFIVKAAEGEGDVSFDYGSVGSPFTGTIYVAASDTITRISLNYQAITLPTSVQWFKIELISTLYRARYVITEMTNGAIVASGTLSNTTDTEIELEFGYQTSGWSIYSLGEIYE